MVGNNRRDAAFQFLQTIRVVNEASNVRTCWTTRPSHTDMGLAVPIGFFGWPVGGEMFLLTAPFIEPANGAGVATDFIRPFSQKTAIQLPASIRSESVCEPFHEAIELGLSRGRNARSIWQELVSDHGFSGAYNAVKRFVRKLRGSTQPEAVGIIVTGPGEEA